MSVIDSSRAKLAIGATWIICAIVTSVSMFTLPGQETVRYGLIWASFALLYGMVRWPVGITWTVFTVLTVITGLPLIDHAKSGLVGVEEFSEIFLMGVILSLLVWHVNRQWKARDRLVTAQNNQRAQADQREIAARTGSHEVRTRLTIARGHAEMIAAYTTDPQTRADTQIVVTELVKATTLATNILTLVRFAQPVNHQAVNVDDLLVAIMRRWFAAAHRDWTCVSTAGTVLGNSERLEAALDCLIENAIKFTDYGDRIDVEAHVDADFIVISVQDAGHGIPQADISRIFHLFEVGSDAKDRAGSGIGLAVVRAVADARGGTVTVESTPGLGSCFTMTMPLIVSLTAEPVGEDKSDTAAQPSWLERVT